MEMRERKIIQITLVIICWIRFIFRSVGGIVVSIAAFQAVDPGSIPGRRNFKYVERKFANFAKSNFSLFVKCPC